MNFHGVIKSKTFLFGVIVLFAYIFISAMTYNLVILKMTRDMSEDNGIQQKLIQLSDNIRLSIESAQDVVLFTKENNETKVKIFILKLSTLIGLVNKGFLGFNNGLKGFPSLEKIVLPYENNVHHKWENVIIPTITPLIHYHKIAEKKIFIDPKLVTMYESVPYYTASQPGFGRKIQNMLNNYRLLTMIIFITGFLLFLAILLLFLVSFYYKELRIERSKKKYRMLFDSINDIVFVVQYTKEGSPMSFIDVNNTALKVFGYDKDDFLKLFPLSIIHKTGHAAMEKHFKELILKGHLTYETSYVTKSGNVIQVEAADNIFDMEKTKIGVCIARDVSSRKILEKKLLASYREYDDLVKFLPIGVYQATIDEGGHFISVNDYMVKIFEASSKEELINARVEDLYTKAGLRADVIKDILKKEVHRFEGKRKTLKGRIIDVFIACRLKKDDEGKSIIDCVLLDITKEKGLHDSLKKSEELFRITVNNMSEGVCITGNKIIYANPAAVEFLGYSEQELCGMYVWDLFDVKDMDTIKTDIARRLKGEQFYFEYTFRTLTKKGESKYVFFHVQTIVYQERFVALVILFDITNNVLLKRRLEREKMRFQKLSETDHLTGIFNKRKLENILSEYVKLVLRYDRPLSLMMFDIDYFKEINDGYGHQIGDNVLIELTDLIKVNSRETDFFARFGGEEFVILLPETNLTYASAKAENLRKLIEKHNFKYIRRLTCSFGVAEYNEKDDLGQLEIGNVHPEDVVAVLIERVDRALYRAKENGRNRIEEDI